MTKVAYNNCFGGFGLSHDAIMTYAERKGIKLYFEVDPISQRHEGNDPRKALLVHYYKVPAEQYNALSAEVRSRGESFKRLNEKDWYFSCRDISRTDPDLIAVIEELGDIANGRCSKLAIEEIPEGTQYRIDEYDGNETVATRDSYDWKTA